MSDLISYSQWKVLTNTTDDTNQTLIEQLITIASNNIQNYCDRIFNADTYIEWINATNGHIPRQYPVQKVLYLGVPTTALRIINGSSTNTYMVDISNAILTISEPDLTETSYDLTNASYDTLSELETVIESDYADLAVTVYTDKINQTSQFLYPRAYQIEEGGAIDITGAQTSGANITVTGDTFYINGSNWYGYYCDLAKYVIAYKAGYTTIPTDLQLVCANSVNDALGVQLGETSTNIKSEGVEHYNYTLGDTIDMRSIVNNYAASLAFYKRINF